MPGVPSLGLNIDRLKCDATKNKIFAIMGFTEIFWKNMIKNAYRPKINIVLQFGDEILALAFLAPVTPYKSL